jgi:hypothetical protein
MRRLPLEIMFMRRLPLGFMFMRRLPLEKVKLIPTCVV